MTDQSLLKQQFVELFIAPRRKGRFRAKLEMDALEELAGMIHDAELDLRYCHALPKAAKENPLKFVDKEVQSKRCFMWCEDWELDGDYPLKEALALVISQYQAAALLLPEEQIAIYINTRGEAFLCSRP